MKLVITDSGRKLHGFAGERNDCMIRAFAITHRMSYRRAYALITDETGRKPKQPTKVGDDPGDDISHYTWLRKYYECVQFGINKFANAINITGTKPVILLGWGHVVTVKKNIMYDLEDSRTMRVHSIWEPK